MILLSGGETHWRSVFKSFSWRTLGTLDTFAISWWMTGRVEIAGSIAGLEVLTKIVVPSPRAYLDSDPVGTAQTSIAIINRQSSASPGGRPA